MDRTEYFAQDHVVEALGELEEAAFAARERGEDALPDAMAFLRERGVDPPGGGGIRVVLSVEDPGTTPKDLESQPSRFTCPEGSSGECIPKNCKWIKGQYVCSWICDCR